MEIIQFMSLNESIISILTNENSKKILISLIETEKAPHELSSALNIPLSTTYRILKYLENEGLIIASKMTLSFDGHHSKIYRAKFNKIVLTIDSQDIKVHLILEESEKLKDIWKKLGDMA